MSLITLLEFLQDYDVCVEIALLIVTTIGIGITIYSIRRGNKNVIKQLKLTKYPQIILNLLPHVIGYNEDTGILQLTASLLNEGESAALNVTMTYKIGDSEEITCPIPNLSSVHKTGEMYLPVNVIGSDGNPLDKIKIAFKVTYHNIFLVKTVLETEYILKSEYHTKGKNKDSIIARYRLESREVTYKQYIRNKEELWK